MGSQLNLFTGTDIKDVVCEPCEAGFTSDNKSSTEPCVKKEEGGGDNPSQRIENVRTEYETKPVKEKIYRCLKLWIRVQGNEATNARFVAALRDWRPGQQSEDIIRRYFPYNINSVITDV
ncbi:hypothetical protein MAR_005116 [Mya arenaria]|uniref:Death domain-containing protein n=1 Tax=Mya arenaria TaxID=6604 RepID=A0ABY7F6T3_MYAAR|nr:hypothetical protein MAR_005116 [Mya arenaria]